MVALLRTHTEWDNEKHVASLSYFKSSSHLSSRFLPYIVDIYFQKNMTVVAQLKGTTAEALMAEIKEEERRGKIVAGTGRNFASITNL